MVINLKNIFFRLFIITMVWFILEGILRKWIIPQLSSPLFFVKYILAAGLYLIYLIQYQSITKIKRLDQLLITIYIIWALFSLFNNRLESPIIVPIIGLIIHLAFIPISNITQYFVTNEERLERFIKYLGTISLALCILGFYQYYLPNDHILNTFVNDTQIATKIGAYTRVTSVFSFVKVYNIFLLFTLTLITAYIYQRLLNGKSIIFYLIIFVALVINTFMTGSRLPLFLTAFNILLISVYVFFNYSQMRKTVVFISFSALALFITMYFSTSLLNDSVDSFIQRTNHIEGKYVGQNTSDAEIRLLDRLDSFKYSEISGFTGYGIGSTYQGNASFLKNRIPVYYEEEGERLVLELGVFGGGIIMLMRLFLFLYSFFCFKNTKNLSLKLISLSLTLLLLPPVLFLNETTFNYFDNFTYWFTIGLVIAIKNIDSYQRNEKSIL